METNNEINQAKEERTIPPFLGFFNLSATERIINSFLIGLIGIVFVSYIVWTKTQSILDFNDVMMNLSGWYVMPWYFLSATLLISAWPLSEMKTRIKIFRRVSFRFVLLFGWMILYLELIIIVFGLFFKYLPA